MSGFAFAAIYKDPIPPGPGPDGPDIPPIDPDDDPSYYTYTISGESIKPFVPFTVTVTGSNSKAKGNHGNLQADIDYEIRDGGAWEGGKCEWTLGTRVCDSKRTNAKFSWLISGREPVTATLAYDAGTMTPDLAKDILSLGETVGFTITYSHAQNCYATRFADFGASYWWEAQKNGTWERTNRIPVNQTPSFSNGVLSGNAYIGNLAGYDKIRLCVSYAGRDTVYAEASLVASDVTITLGADSLHCFGASTSLEIESDSLELMTAAFYRGDNTTEDITDTNGTPIAFTFSGTTWTGNIQAATAATAGTVVLKVFYNNEVVATREINVVTVLYGEIEADTPIMQGESIEATGTINGGDYTLTRLPAETVKLEVDSGALKYNEAGEDTIELSYTPVSSGTYTVLLVDIRDETILDQLIVEVASIYAALAEAINERMAVKSVDILVDDDYNETHYVGTEGEANLAQAAKIAMRDFAKVDWDETTGTFTRYTDNNINIALTLPEGMTEAQWMADCYNKVCSATTLVGNTQRYAIDGICKFQSETYRGQGQYTGQWDADKQAYPSQSDVVGEAKSRANADYKLTSTGLGHDVKAYTNVGKYQQHWCICTKQYDRTRIYCQKSFPTANTIKVFFNVNQLYTPFDDFGGGMSVNTYPCLCTFSQAANQHGTSSDSNWVDGGEPTFRNADNGDSDVARGYRASLNGMSISFNFKHK